MFGLGFSELLVLGAVVVLFFYGRRLPDLVRAIGRSKKTFREGLASDDDRKLRDVRPLDRPPGD